MNGAFVEREWWIPSHGLCVGACDTRVMVNEGECDDLAVW